MVEPTTTNNISVSDMRNFLRCRRQWDLTSPNRQNLSRPTTFKSYYFVGSVIHEVMERMAMGQYNGIDTLDEVMDAQIAASEEDYREVVGVGFSAGERQLFDAHRELAQVMVSGYAQQYMAEGSHGEDSLGANFEFVHAELPFKIPLFDNVDDDLNVFLLGTFDDIAVSKQTGKFWIVDTKTYGRKTEVRNIVLDDQFNIYRWAFEKLFGFPPAGLIYNGLLKKKPTVPKVVAGGKRFSTTKIDTTYATYLQAIHDNDLNEDDYREILDNLKHAESTGQGVFFNRIYVPFGADLKHTDDLIYNLAAEVNNEPRIYPHRPYNGCPGCTVNDICEAMTRGDDTESIVATYSSSNVYGSFAAKDPIMPAMNYTLPITPLHQRVSTIAEELSLCV